MNNEQTEKLISVIETMQTMHKHSVRDRQFLREQVRLMQQQIDFLRHRVKKLEERRL